MSVIVSDVEKHSPADKKGIKPGFLLLKINSNEINDFLDYSFYIKESRLVVDFKTTDGTFKRVLIEKNENDDIGLCFETYLMDKQTRCRNGCVFCFIDQLPKGMRDSLYFKDDDSRLSFLFGNYITLTNLSDSDAERIIKMHISPVNVSVHTMNPELRIKMMKNKFAGDSLKYLKRFADAGIKLNTQLVLCPGINDGDELIYSLEKLSQLYPAVESIACVPVGLTKFRDGLYPLKNYDKETAEDVIRIVEDFAESFNKRYSTNLAYCSDEFYLLAEKEIPSDEYYESYPQIENGVGLWRSLETEFVSALESGEYKLSTERKVAVATGVAAYPLIKKLSALAEEKYVDLSVDVFEIKNSFFGEKITVSGLVTGQDLIKQLKGKITSEILLIPSSMLRSEGDVFLDDVSLSQLSDELNVQVVTVSNYGCELLEKILN